MALDRATLRRFGGTAVVTAFAVLLGFWVLLRFDWLQDPFVGPLLPLWLPAYLSVLFASWLRNVYLPWLGSGTLFWTVSVLFLYAEAVLLAGAYRVIREGFDAHREDNR